MNKEESDLASPSATAPRARPNKKQASRERSIKKIMDSALRLFVRQGYAHTTIDEIADASGLTKGAVYHYYGSKEDLLLELLGRIERESMEVTEDAYGEGTSAAEKFVRYLHKQAANAAARPDNLLFVVTLTTDQAGISGRVRKQVDAIHRRLAKGFEDIIREGIKSGEFRSRISERELSLFYIAVYSGNVLQWHRQGRQPQVGEALVRALRISVLSILGVSSTTPRPQSAGPGGRKRRGGAAAALKQRHPVSDLELDRA
jgi:AcrR family transcriptional regulator